ncbi:hypothetical protein B0H14DRAFT_2643405 [Mycena olivaceomarginata]|nr:hypothetical protein B0H14DRAFT_2643405 [Mycena olivaceomarginata]
MPAILGAELESTDIIDSKDPEDLADPSWNLLFGVSHLPGNLEPVATIQVELDLPKSVVSRCWMTVRRKRPTYLSPSKLIQKHGMDEFVKLYMPLNKFNRFDLMEVKALTKGSGEDKGNKGNSNNSSEDADEDAPMEAINPSLSRLTGICVSERIYYSAGKSGSKRKRKHNDSDDHTNPSSEEGSSNSKRGRKGKEKAVGNGSDTESSNAQRVASTDPKTETSSSALWTTPAYIEMDDVWMGDNVAPSLNEFAAARLDCNLLVEMHEDATDPLNIGPRGPDAPAFGDVFDSGIKLVQRFELAVIQRDHSAVQSASQRMDCETTNVVVETSSLCDAFEGILKTPSAIETSICISRIWKQVNDVSHNEADAALALKLHRQSIMLTTFCAWAWLDSYCVEIITDALNQPLPATWIGRLAKHVQMLMTTRAAARELQAADFGLDALNTVYAYRQRCTLDLDVPASQVITLVLDIIASWLNFPTKSKSRAQAWFVDAMIHACHPNTLFLDSVWYAFGHLDAEIFGGRNAKISSPAAFYPLRAALQTSLLAKASSQEFLLLEDMKLMLHRYRVRFTSALDSTPPPHLLLEASDSKEMHMMNRFLDALLELEPLIDNGYAKIAAPTLFQASVNKKLDFLLPFREHGPSRARSRLPGNSFDPAHVRSRGGLFSGLIFRAVIFATPFSMEAQTYFSSPEDWDIESARFSGHDTSFFCNLSAYGRAKSRRGTHLVCQHWDAIITDGCPDWEAKVSEDPWDFTECYAFLKADKPSRFREVGPLIAFLLAADFVYAVATIIRDLNKGGMKGLEQLGLVPPRPSGTRKPQLGNVQEVQAGFKRLYSFLDTKLSSMSKSRMGFDGFMVENSLCKWTRWVKEKLIPLKS